MPSFKATKNGIYGEVLLSAEVVIPIGLEELGIFDSARRPAVTRRLNAGFVQSFSGVGEIAPKPV
jgi:hypothetical protein